MIAMREGGPKMASDSTTLGAGGAAPAKGLTGFFKRLAQYYAEFLSTDFKKQRLPKRRLENSDAQGRLVGIPLRKYPGFQQKMWEELAKPIGAGLSLPISRGSWRAVLPKTVVETTATYIAQVTQADLNSVIDGLMKSSLRLVKEKGNDPDIAFERFIEEVRASLARQVIAPLLDRMEGFFARTENKPVESLRELEDELSTRLSNGIETSAGSAFSKLLVEGKEETLEQLVRDQLDINLVRGELEGFFATFTAADLYVDLSDLVRSSRLIENVDFYMHIGEVHYSSHVFPIFYIPFTAERGEQGFNLKSEPRVYVNKRAMDYVAQEVARAEGRATIPSMLRERIFYLYPDQSPLGLAQKIFDDLAGSFNLRAEIDFREPRDQRVSSLLVVATNRLSFSLFDRSDESMINDYEALLTGIEAGGNVIDFFKSLIDEFLLKNPVSVREDVDREWDVMPMPQRLVFDSPLPLVEEQRKILSAIKHSKSRFIAVEGPPGTGKSHTITAVAFDLILSGKNLLVLSDKREALDVVEDKLNQALAKVRPIIHEHPRADEIYNKLRLKVMTFDTCQGEEREIVFYSLVATAEKDRLAYIFPTKLDRDNADAVDHNLRLQRLNVGLSRGQEKIVIVHSKPFEQYSSSLRVALLHYRNELERAKSMPTEEDVDEESPMERQVLHWLGQVPLIRDLGDDAK
jgi:hypothetical protein